MIKLEHIYKTYQNLGQNRTAIKDISINFPAAGFFSIVGKSGAGKSTLLNIIAGLDRPDSGNILFNGVRIDNDKMAVVYRNHMVGMIFQDYHLMQDLTVKENIQLALDLQGKRNQDGKIEDVLSRLHIAHLADSRANELSGGEKQRVCIARAIIKGAKVILADEPTGNLDDENEDIIFNLLKELSIDILIILVTHNKEKALSLSDQVIFLESGEISSVADKIFDSDDRADDLIVQSIKSKERTGILSQRLILKNKKRQALMLLLSVITLSFFAFSFNLLTLDSETMFYNALKQNDFMDFYIQNDSTDDYTSLDQKLGTYKTIEHSFYYRNAFFLLEKLGLNGRMYDPNSKWSRFYIDQFFYFGIGDYDFLSPGEIAITDYLASSIMFYGDVEEIKPSEFIGREVKINGHLFKIASIIDTDFEDYFDLVDDSFNYYDNKELDFKVKHQYSTIYMLSSDYEAMAINPDHSQVAVTDSKMEILNAKAFTPGWLDEQIPNADQEIALSYGYLLQYNLASMGDFASFIGEQITINYVSINNEVLQKTYEVVGTYDSYQTSVVLTDAEYQSVASQFSFVVEPDEPVIHLLLGNKSESVDLLAYLNRSDLTVFNLNWNSYTLSMSICDNIGIISLVLGLIFMLLSVGMISHFITTYISDNMELIGTLRALGAGNKSIGKMFLWRSTLQLLIVIPISIMALVLINNEINNYSKRFELSIDILYFNPLTILVLILFSSLLYYSCTFIPLHSFFKKDVNTLIYNRQ